MKSLRGKDVLDKMQEIDLRRQEQIQNQIKVINRLMKRLEDAQKECTCGAYERTLSEASPTLPSQEG